MVDLTQLFLYLLLELVVAEYPEREAVLLAQKCMVLVEAVKVFFIEFLYEQVPHRGLLQLRQVIPIRAGLR